MQTLHINLTRSRQDFPVDFFTDPEWSESIAGLSSQLSEGGPFCFSLVAFKWMSEIKISGKSRVCLVKNGQSESHTLGHLNKEMSAKYASQALTILGFSDLHSAIVRCLGLMAEHVATTAFSVSICAHGIIILPDYILSKAAANNPSSFARVIIPENLSQHQLVQTQANLLECAQALLDLQTTQAGRNANWSATLDLS